VVDDEAWRAGWELKVFGYINMCRSFYKHMANRGHGVIINNIGNSGENPDIDYIAGSSGNASLMAFSLALGGRSMDHGVRVVAVNPGPIDTGRMEKMLKQRAKSMLGDEGRWQELLARFPGGRGGTAEEVGDLIVFLASERAGFISGCVMTIDGGITARRSVV
jgi:NAD(P)-dependent dehydrogenase (short-subunit alcohol dehydrogenase family)